MIEAKVVREEAPEYPKLMVGKSSGTIVLLSEHSAGTVVHPGAGAFAVGYHFTHFDMGRLEPFTGTVTLRNK